MTRGPTIDSLGTAILGAVIVAGLGRADEPPAADAAIRLRIAEVGRIAAAIVIDGKADDWAGIPAIEAVTAGRDREPDDPARRIARVAIAPRPDALLVRIDTAASPSRGPFAFWFEVDLKDDPRPELRVGLGGDRRRDTLYVAGSGTWEGPSPLRGVRHAIGDVVEVELPYDVLAEKLPPALAESLRGPAKRSWLRVTPRTWDEPGQAVIDHGPSIASFRLDPDGPPLDPPLPRNGRATKPVKLPVEGSWLVVQGPFGELTHGDLWAIDLSKMSPGLRPSIPEESRNLEDYLAWDHPVLSPRTAKVLRATRDEPDGPPGSETRGTPNQVELDLSGELALKLSHFRRGTLAVSRGQTARTGQVLGRLGNSGTSTFPHLHVECVHKTSGESRPTAFAMVRVKLNDTPDDAWARDLDIWIPRIGFFVEDRAAIGRMKSGSER